jgi:hypothetical protein
MKSEAIARSHGFQVLLAGACMLCCGPVPADLPSSAPGGATQGDLAVAFKTCVSLYNHALAGDLMRTIGDRAAREAFAATHADAVRKFSVEREHGYSTATAVLKSGVSVAGIPVHAIYASTCELECPLAVWGLELGATNTPQRKALQSWIDSAPATHTETHGDIKVQMNTLSDDSTVLVCDVSD